MLKFLYTGDLHLDEQIPKSRIDDFEQTRKDKIKEIIDIAKDNNVKCILHGGDFFNRPKLSNEYVASIIDLFNEQLINDDMSELLFKYKSGLITLEQLSNKINKDIPIVSIIGNHDLIGAHIDSYNRTSLNILDTSGFLKIIDKDNPIFYVDGDKTIAITGTHYDANLDKTDDKYGYCIDKKYQYNNKDVDYHIHLVHGMLTDKSYGKKFPHTTIHEIEPNTIADLTISGHDHIGFDMVEINNKLFVNPGSPFRLTIDKKEINRKPKVLLIEIDNGIKVTPIYLKSAKKGTDVLNDGTNNNNIKNAVAQIQTLINQSSLQRGLKIADIINNIGNADNIDKDILKDVQDKIIESMNILQPPFNPVGNYYITKLELKNFLSHKDSVFEFTDGLNVLVGKSRNGKSAVLRALREVLTCSLVQPREAIFFGASYFSITIHTSNGYIITRKVERDEKKGFNGYEIYDPTTGVLSEYNTKAVSLVQEILGYNRIPLTEKKSIDVNSVIQGESWFFIGNNMTAPDRARLLGTIYGTHYADAANKNIISNIKKLTTSINNSEKEKTRLENDKKSYDYLPKLNQTLQNAEQLLIDIEEKEKILDKIKSLTLQLSNIKAEMNDLTLVKNALNQNYMQDFLTIKEMKTKLDNSNMLYNNMLQVISSGKEFRQILNSFNNLNNLKQDFNELKINLDKLTEDKQKYSKYIELDTICKNILSEKETLTKVNNNLFNIENIKILYNELLSKNKELITFKETSEKAILLNKQSKQIEQQKLDLQNVLSNLNNIPKDLNNYIKLSEDINRSKELHKQLNEIITEGTTNRKLLKENEAKTLQLIDEYKVALENLGECPICHSRIDTIIVNNLVSQHKNNFS